jgi:hypothetical protein
MPSVHPDRTPAAAARLTKALSVLKRNKGDATQGATISQLCRLAGVSRNAVYRYHPKILAELRTQQGRDFHPSGKWASSEGTNHAQLQDQISKLTALVDHYYAAYRETRALLDRRDRQLAELRRKLNSAPVAIRR